MPIAIEDLKSELAVLTNGERADLAHFLIQSLDQDAADEDADSAWDAELARRVAEIEGGSEIGKPAEQVFAELREKYT